MSKVRHQNRDAIMAANKAKWSKLIQSALPFADAASDQLPLGRLLRLSLFQVSVGMAVVLLNGVLNRIMIVELGVAASVVAIMVALPLVFAPARALIGFKSDTHKSFLGWRRVPYIWFGTLLQWGGLAILPFALIILSGDHNGPAWAGPAAAGLAFLLVGAGLHTTQTAGLALANDLAPEDARPRVVALLYVMLLLGMVVSAAMFSFLLADFNKVKLIQVIQGAAVVTLLLNVIAMWKQEPRNRELTLPSKPRPTFSETWARYISGGKASRLLLVVGLGSAGFSMQDILLEPYGGEILHLSVSQTTVLTGILALGALAGFGIAARALSKHADPCRLAAYGLIVGTLAFSAVIFASPLQSPDLFRLGTVMIGFGGGLFSVGTLTAAMALADDEFSGLAIGAWGAVQATATGLAIAAGGILRDVIGHMAANGQLGPPMSGPDAGYTFVYHLEILFLFATLVAIGPLVRSTAANVSQRPSRFGLAELPG